MFVISVFWRKTLWRRSTKRYSTVWSTWRRCLYTPIRSPVSLRELLMLWSRSNLSIWSPILLTATATWPGSPTGWEQKDSLSGVPDAQPLNTWRTDPFMPYLPMNLGVLVSFQKTRIDEIGVGQFFREVFWGLKHPRTFSLESQMDLFETLWVTFDPFRPLKVSKMDFSKEA